MVIFYFIPSTCINWNSSVRKGYCFWIYIFNYNKIFRISTNLELKVVNYIKMIPNTNVKERKMKLVTCFRKYEYNELMKESSIYDL